MKPVHIKIYCKNCGKLLLHQRVEISDDPILDNPLRSYVGLEVDLCEDCVIDLLIAEKVSN